MEPDTSKLERLVSDTERSIHEKKDVVMHKIEQENENLEVSDSEKPAGAGLPPTEALKRFFDRIPLFSVPGIGNAGVLELNMTDTISAAVEKLYVHKVLGAPVRDPQQSNNMPLTDQYVGLLDFASLVLWVLEEFEAAEADAKLSGMVLSPTDAPQNATASVEARNPGRAEEHVVQAQEQLARVAQGQQAPPPETTGTLQSQRQPPSREGFFGLLDKLPNVNSTQVSAMARSFRWGPFLPVRPEDTLLHVLLLLSKHRLKAVPVVDTESSNSVRGFITQDVAVQLLLQCEGLHWFETIAESTLSNAGFETERNAGQMVFVYGDDSLMKALRAMWKYRISGVPILDRSSKSLIGNIRYCDVRIVLDKPQVFLRRKEMSTQEFMSESKGSQGGAPEPHPGDFGTAESAAALSLADIQTAAMQDPVTFTASETMKEAMQKLFKARSDRGFIVDTNGHVTGVVTLRDILMKFAPPIADAVPMGGFFDSALQQTGAFMGPVSVVTVRQS